jgi:MHS family proline/betaine transporter-like MFS transporter
MATIFMGIMPSFASIGIWASIMITATKAVQLFCFGGEYNGAGIYVVEHAQNKNEAFIGSTLTAMMLLGSLLATLIAFATTLDGMPSWGWRVAFIFGGLIGIVGVACRKNLEESPNFQVADRQQHTIIALIKQYPYQLLAGVFIGGFATVPFTTVIAFMNPVLMTQNFMSSQTLMLLQSFLIVVAIVTLVIAGKIADKKSPQSVMRVGALMLAIFSFPLLWLVDQGLFGYIVAAESALIIINEILLGPSNACLKNLFPMQFRYRGASLSFTLGLSIFGALTPLVENYLYQLTGCFSSMAIWLVFVGVGTFISINLAQTRVSAAIVKI